jgi:putative endonuclease
MYVYIIQSVVNHSFYTGMTSDIEKRILEHNSGKGTYTKKFMPWKLVYFEVCENRIAARKREKYLKTAEGKISVLKK